MNTMVENGLGADVDATWGQKDTFTDNDLS